MPGITLKNGLISYYGNPAGYTEKETAIVDSIFQNDELTNWLKSRSLTPQWTDGVYPMQLFAKENDFCTTVPSSSMMTASWFLLATSIPTIKFTQSPAC